MILLSKNEVNRFYRLMDQHRYSEALPYGQSLLDKDPFDGAGIRFGLMSACVMLKDVDSAEKIARKVSASMKTSLADAPFVRGKKDNWLSYLDPAMLYPLAMVHWKVCMDTAQTRNAGDAEGTDGASYTGRETSCDINRTLECLAAIKAWPSGWKMLKEFMNITAFVNEGEYVTKRTKLQTMYNPITAEGLIVCVNVDLKELKEFNAWIEKQQIPSVSKSSQHSSSNSSIKASESYEQNENDGNDENTDGNSVVGKKKFTADEGVHDLTLALLYLSRISSSPDPTHYWDAETSYRASAAFDKRILSWLNEVGFVETAHHSGSHTASREKAEHSVHHHGELTITPAGVHRAREILDNLNIDDWDIAEIVKNNKIANAHKTSETLKATEMSERTERS